MNHLIKARNQGTIWELVQGELAEQDLHRTLKPGTYACTVALSIEKLACVWRWKGVTWEQRARTLVTAIVYEA